METSPEQLPAAPPVAGGVAGEGGGEQQRLRDLPPGGHFLPRPGVRCGGGRRAGLALGSGRAGSLARPAVAVGKE